MEKEKKFSFVVASDHTDRGKRIARAIIEFLKAQGHRGILYDKDCGPQDDFPIIARGAVEKICSGEIDRAILIGGSGSGMAMVANKFKGIRAAVVGNADDMRHIAKRDFPNVICLPAWNFDPGLAVHLVRIWLTTPPSEEPKYLRRVEEIKSIEEQNFK